MEAKISFTCKDFEKMPRKEQRLILKMVELASKNIKSVKSVKKLKQSK